MAERLTEKCSFGSYVVKDYADKGDTIEKVKNHEIIDKLGKLEDILEKYGIDIQNLDYILNDYSKNQGRDFAICEERDNLKKDCDTWKRACELACDVLRDINYKIYNEDRIDFENIFYQQAKKEGNNEQI